MIPILASSYPYTGNGLGGLSDALSCVVTHEVNGIYELMMTYPITGIHFDEILHNEIIMAKPDNMTQAQPFRIYRITKPLNGIVTIYAQHISYDMSGTIVTPFTASSLQNALTVLPTKCTPATSFTITSSRSVATGMTVTEPIELWRLLGGTVGSFLYTYGGEWDFDCLTADLKTRLGSDRGVEIRYGKNMTQLEQDVTLESTYYGVYPFWYDEESSTLVTLPEGYVTTGGTLTDRILLMDFSDSFDTAPTETQLRDRTNAYITNNAVGDAKMTWKVDFALLGQSEEYWNMAALEQVMLGDTIKVVYEALGVNATARAVKVEHNVLLDKYNTVTIGRVKQNLASIIVGESRDTDQKIKTTKSALEQAIDHATDFITNGAGYMRFIYDSSDNLVEIVSLDNADISQATSVWRWNNGGFGHSSTGYNGNYTTAITQNGAIVADFITSGTLDANVIRAGVIADTSNKNTWDLSTGIFTTTSGKIGRYDITSTYLRAWGTTGDNTTCVGIGATQAFWAGNSTSSSAPFRVSYSGDLVATSATITGNITMTGGTVDITSSSLAADIIKLSYTGSVATMRASGYEVSSSGLSPYRRVSIDYNGITATEGGTTSASISKDKIWVGTHSGSTLNNVISLDYSSGIKWQKSSSEDYLTVSKDGHDAVTLTLHGYGSNTTGARITYSGAVFQDSSSTTRINLSQNGLTFYDASGNETYTYPATGLTIGTADLTGNEQHGYSSTGTRTITLATGTYLITSARYNNANATQDGMWIASVYSGGTSHMTALLSPTGGTTASISGDTLSVTTGSSNVRITITKLS